MGSRPKSVIMNSVHQYAPTLQKVLLFGLFFALLFLSFSVLKYFIVPVVWAYHYCLYDLAAVSAGFAHVQTAFHPQRNTDDFTGGSGGWPAGHFCHFPVSSDEGRNLYYELQKQVFSGHVNVPDFIRQLPFIGKEVSRTLRELNNDPNSIIQSVQLWIQGHLNYGKILLNEVSKNIFKLCFAVMSLFFFYRDGQTILGQVSKALEMVIGPRVHHYLSTISDTTRAVVYGVGLTAVAQAALAGLSYFVAGVPNPMLLTIVTFVLALIPFGPQSPILRFRCGCFHKAKP